MTQQANLPDTLCNLYKYNDQLEIAFQKEVESEAANLGRKRCKARDSILVACIRACRDDKVQGTLLQMLCDALDLDPEKEERALLALPGKPPNAEHAGADRRWRMLVCELSGMSRKETLRLIRNAKPYKTSGARRQMMIDKLLEDTAAEQSLLFKKPSIEQLIPFWDEAEHKVRKRHSRKQTPHEKSLAWLMAVEWLGDHISPSVEDFETNFERYCARLMVGHDGDQFGGRMSHRLWQKNQVDDNFRLLQTEIKRINTPQNVADLLRMLWHHCPIEAEEAKLLKPQEERAPATIGKGMTWQTAKEKAEQHVKRNGFPGVNALAKIVGCVPSTMSKAIKRSSCLKARMAVHIAEHQSKPLELSMTDYVLDNVQQTTELNPEDTVLKSLVAQQEADDDDPNPLSNEPQSRRRRRSR